MSRIRSFLTKATQRGSPLPSICAGNSVHNASAAPLNLIVEGWRFLPHSYAIVNQWHLLGLLTRDVRLKVRDAPFHRPWQTQAGLFDPQAECALQALEIAEEGAKSDVTLRIFAPFTFAPSASPLTAVFATLEQQVIRRHQMAAGDEYERLRRQPPPPEVRAVTPSRWSAAGFYRAGFQTGQVRIVPHGVDTATFRPVPDIRPHARESVGLRDDHFVFLSVGAMTANKGMDLLLRAFAQTARSCPSARLVLKGLDPLYRSKARLQQWVNLLSTADQHALTDKVIYRGEVMSHREMAKLYQAADVYVSPYRAEGFNLPVLEAAACGLPIICTRGGPTDDFVNDEFARRIESKVAVTAVEGQDACHLDPNLDHLIALMTSALTETIWRRHAAEAGPHHVRASYTWDHIVAQLLSALMH
jgi:glycosyltransferase involved in cell wall biosynthesis